MSASDFAGFSTPRRRPMTPGRRDHVLPTFNSPASIRLGRMLESAYAGNNGTSLDDELPDQITDELSNTAVSAAVAATTEEYDPPRVWFQREEDRRQNDEFTKRVDEMVQELKRLVRERKADHDRQITECAEREARMSSDMELLEKENKTILSALQSDLSEEDALSKAINSLQSKQHQAEQETSKLAKRKAKLELELKRRQEAIAEKRQVLDRQMAKNKPEIKFFEDKMGISIVGGQKDALTFVFTQISLSEPSRPFSISIDLSQREYRVLKCKPDIANLQTHVDWLNASRDFFGFLKRVRHEFSDTYFNEGG
ncbi:kinetochore-associated Ndc80 complex subunit spc25 [Dipsacomyces acuminosporus]|nr:kinetochore-associated Ndc80 complex subunit spc25 [Dipsacomyces acuminosporus]